MIMRKLNMIIITFFMGVLTSGLVHAEYREALHAGYPAAGAKVDTYKMSPKATSELARRRALAEQAKKMRPYRVTGVEVEHKAALLPRAK